MEKELYRWVKANGFQMLTMILAIASLLSWAIPVFGVVIHFAFYPIIFKLIQKW